MMEVVGECRLIGRPQDQQDPPPPVNDPEIWKPEPQILQSTQEDWKPGPQGQISMKDALRM
eukprot:10233547-Karenia_brevis.AAC.1